MGNEALLPGDTRARVDSTTNKGLVIFHLPIYI